MKKNVLSIILLVAFIALPFKHVNADIWYVNGDALVSGDGKSWGGAFKFIWEATQFEAEDGDEVWVKKGTYTLISPILVITACEIYGGFSGGETMRSQRSWIANVTTIDGYDPVEGYVANCFDVSDSATIDGFTITNGKANGSSHPVDQGGAIHIKNSSAPTIANCIFTSNYGKYGGAIYAGGGCAPTITDCKFDNNSCITGGGIYLQGGSSTITNCEFEDNIAVNWGAGIWNDSTSIITGCNFYSNEGGMGGGGMGNGTGAGSSVISHCTFTSNESLGFSPHGAGIYNYYAGSNVKIINCSFYANTSGTYGGGIGNSTSSPLILNCSFSGNSAQIGGALQNELDSDAVIYNCIFWGDTASFVGSEIHSDFDANITIDNCDIGQTGFEFNNNINVNPNWVGSGNFHLLTGSPCIDTGTNTPVDIPATDIDGEDRKQDGDNNGSVIVDMGVDEFVYGLMPPGTPANPSPADGASSVPVSTAILDWDDSAGATSYDVYFDTSSSPANVGNVSQSFYYLPGLSNGMIYYWKIVAKNAAGSTSGPEWDFTTEVGVVQYTLTIGTTTGGTTDPAPGGHSYDDGTPVEVDALEDSGYLFSYWSGDVPHGHEMDNPVTITMDGDKSITANFAQISWKSTKRLTWNPSDSGNPNVTVDTDRNVHIVWEDDNPGNYEIYYRRSTDGGVTWTGAKRLTWNSGDSRNPAITNDSNENIYVVWDDDTPGRQEIYCRRSTDGGTTWKAVKRVTQLSGDSRVPSIAVDEYDDIHIAWFDLTPGNNEIFYSRSSDDGATWITPKRITWNPSSSSYPCITTSLGDNVHIVWQDDGPGNEEIYYKRSTNGGGSWPLTKRMTWNSGASMYPGIASDTGNSIHLVWTDLSPGNNEVFYKKSTNGGTNWPVTKRLTWNGGTSGAPSIATDKGDNIYVLWNDDTPGNYEIFYKRSTNGGGAWSTKRLTWNGGDSIVPDLATYSTGEIHIVWADDSPGNQEIYYRKGIQ